MASDRFHFISFYVFPLVNLQLCALYKRLFDIQLIHGIRNVISHLVSVKFSTLQRAITQTVTPEGESFRNTFCGRQRATTEGNILT